MRAAAKDAKQWLLATGRADAGDHRRAGLRVGHDRRAALQRIPGTPDDVPGSATATAPGTSCPLPRVGIDASGWSHERLDDVLKTHLVTYEAAWRSLPDAERCLDSVRRVVRVAVLSTGIRSSRRRRSPELASPATSTSC